MDKNNFEYHLKKDYILDDELLVKKIMKLIQSNQLILLVAPQGTGKTKFINSYFTTQFKYVYISPTRALSEQVTKDNDICSVYGTTHHREDLGGACDKYGLDNSKDISTTMASSEFAVEEYGQEYDALVIDEPHKMIQYSTFAYLQLERTMKVIDCFLKYGKKVILTTATPELLSCLGDGFNNKIDCEILINSEKKYISGINIIQNHSLKNLIIRNHKEGKLQIVLNNNKNENEKIIGELPQNIKGIHIKSENLKDNIEVLQEIQEGTNKGIDVLVVTSWADCGLNFISDNILNIYCIFDTEYKRGDFTIIRQFMARARNSKPMLYIREPVLTDREFMLTELYIKNGTVTDREKQSEKLFNLLEPVAIEGLIDYKKGLISKECVIVMDGIYKTKESDYGERYEYSPVTLNYQIDKIIDKFYYQQNGFTYLQSIFNCNDIDIQYLNICHELRECNIIEQKVIVKYIKELYDNKTELLQDDFRDKIRELSNNKIGYNDNGTPKKFQVKLFIEKITNCLFVNQYTVIECGQAFESSHYYKIIDKP